MRRITTEVITPAPGFDLTTLAAVKLEFDIRDTDNDRYWQTQITRASHSVAAYCRRIFARQVYKETFHSHWRWTGHPRSTIALANWPVIAVTSVDANGLEIDDFDIDAASGRLMRTALWEPGLIEITYTAGWVLPSWTIDVSGDPLPDDVEKAAIHTILANRQAGRLAYTDRDPFLRSETVEGIGTLTYAQTAIGSGSAGGVSAIPQSVKEDLEPYRVPIGAR